MKRGLVLLGVIALAVVVATPALAVKPTVKPPPGSHYNLNIIGFAQCEKTGTTDPDCFNGNAGDIQTSGHTIFVPLKTGQTSTVCNSSIVREDVGEIAKGVRIQVSDGEDMMIVDRDATDGLARFTLPNGCYAVYAKPLGKPDGCMDIDTLICYDDLGSGLEQVDCDGAGLSNELYVAVGHIDVDRTKKQPHWQNVTGELLNSQTGVEGNDYFDFLWSIYNDHLRLLQIRFYGPDPSYCQ